MASLSTLLTLADSRLPTGGHVHSGGVEEAVTSRLVVDLATLDAPFKKIYKQEVPLGTWNGESIFAK